MVTTEEVLKLLENCNVDDFLQAQKDAAKDYDYKNTEWWAMVKYHENFISCPPSPDDMTEKVFHKDFLND